jgi:hypothetical protein
VEEFQIYSEAIEIFSSPLGINVNGDPEKIPSETS